MQKLLTLVTGRRADHRAVFSAFGRGLERVLRRPVSHAAVRRP